MERQVRPISGGTPGLNVRIDRGTKFDDWEEWWTMILGDDPVELDDLEAGSFAQRVYQAVGSE